MPYLIGFGILILFLIAYRFFSRTWDVLKLAEGADGKISSSKFQWLVWTIVALFSYAAIFAARIKFGIYATTLSIPPHLLISMGLSTTTMAAAKGGTDGIVPLFNDDDGIPDLSKILISPSGGGTGLKSNAFGGGTACGVSPWPEAAKSTRLQAHPLLRKWAAMFAFGKRSPTPATLTLGRKNRERLIKKVFFKSFPEA